MSQKNFNIEKLQKVPVQKHVNNVCKKPLVSVCVQTYQHVGFIAQCLDSILVQKTNFEFEILLGEDASTDGTRKICIEYAKKNPDKIRLFLHNRENVIFIDGNPTGRFNMLYNLQHSNGKYIALCEGDDYWTDPYKLQKQVDFLEANEDFSMCFHNAYNDFNGDFKDYIKPMYEKSDTSHKIHFEKIVVDNFIPTCSVLFRNNYFEKIPELFFQCPSGDWFLYSILSQYGKFWYLAEKMSVRRIHNGGIFNGLTLLNSILFKIKTIQIIKKYLSPYYNFLLTKRINNLKIQFIRRIVHKPEYYKLEYLYWYFIYTIFSVANFLKFFLKFCCYHIYKNFK